MSDRTCKRCNETKPEEKFIHHNGKRINCCYKCHAIRQKELRTLKKAKQPIEYIYVLIDPFDGEYRYVGRTWNIGERLSGHIAESSYSNSTTKKEMWIKSLLERDAKPIIKVMDEVSKDEVAEREKYWITMLGLLGCDLFNPEAEYLMRKYIKLALDKR